MYIRLVVSSILQESGRHSDSSTCAYFLNVDSFWLFLACWRVANISAIPTEPNSHDIFMVIAQQALDVGSECLLIHIDFCAAFDRSNTGVCFTSFSVWVSEAL